ncbi:hypothetical protein CO2235_10004 [Cupriavidus oxalaticus]|uniref:Uncharacterized protein n=1 Tax=Cupriavidus oxalaticus TaxID=96344 RepID=A0A375FYK3_9BURK|nr:hypothetical protein CO2235_10004 [Cupriavidus oxalaticus]
MLQRTNSCPGDPRVGLGGGANAIASSSLTCVAALRHNIGSRRAKVL